MGRRWRIDLFGRRRGRGRDCLGTPRAGCRWIRRRRVGGHGAGVEFEAADAAAFAGFGVGDEALLQGGEDGGAGCVFIEQRVDLL